MKEIQELTGYIRGGCSPLGMKKNYPAHIHETALLYPFIYVSAGVRGLQIKLNPHDLIQCCAAMVCRLV
jgi:Cys-tRNA(Pro)/Cys-tRNA(Cys) deacylase